MDGRGGVISSQDAAIRFGSKVVDPTTIGAASQDGGLLSQVSSNPLFTAVSKLRVHGELG